MSSLSNPVLSKLCAVKNFRIFQIIVKYNFSFKAFQLKRQLKQEIMKMVGRKIFNSIKHTGAQESLDNTGLKSLNE